MCLSSHKLKYLIMVLMGEHKDEEESLVKVVELYEGREGYNADNPDMNLVLEAVRFVCII